MSRGSQRRNEPFGEMRSRAQSSFGSAGRRRQPAAPRRTPGSLVTTTRERPEDSTPGIAARRRALVEALRLSRAALSEPRN
jgi:hypothetical protein